MLYKLTRFFTSQPADKTEFKFKAETGFIFSRICVTVAVLKNTKKYNLCFPFRPNILCSAAS